MTHNKMHTPRLPLRVACLTISVLWCCGAVDAQAQLIADINQSGKGKSAGSYANDFINVGGTVLFQTSEMNYGHRIWQTDGTPAGTVPVFGMPRSENFFMQLSYAATVGNVLYFRAQSNSHGSELWRTDGTTTGTYMLKDISPGSASSTPNSFAVLGTDVYFSAETPASGIELWRTDGTAVGTVMVRDIIPGSASSRPFFLHRFGSKILFAALGGLWITDGTAAGTVALTTGGAPYPHFFTVIGNVALFTAHDALGGELWRTDGTVAGTGMLKDIRPGAESSWPDSLVSVGGWVYFSADDGVHGKELWRSDGTAAGTQMVRDMVPGARSSSPAQLQVFGGGVLFRADTTIVSQPWFTDGTAAGTTLLSFAAFEPHAFTVMPATPAYAVFRANGATGRELWRTDGTAAGTRAVTDTNPTGHALSDRPNFFFGVRGSTVVFAADNGEIGEEVWASDGTAAGTRLLKDIVFSVANSSPQPLVEIDGSLLFTANDGSNGPNLWISDGTPTGTKPLAPIWGLPLPPPVRLGRYEYFHALPNLSTREIWRTDGTRGGTTRVTGSGPALSFGSPLVRAGNLIYYTLGTDLWATDGTTSGTRRVFSFSVVFPKGSGPANLTAFQGKLWLTSDHQGVHSIWTSDGTAAGTQRFTSLGRLQLEFTVAGNRMFFMNEDVANGGELWATDGTVAGTRIVRDIVPGPGHSFPKQLTAVQNRVFFVAGYDREVWVSDGTAAGTNQVRNIHPTNTSKPEALTAFGDRLLFHAETPTAGREPWVSDGTLAGTMMIRDVNPGAASSMSPGSPTALDPFHVVGSGRIAVFTADDGVHGNEPWRTDGTTAGTFLAANIADRDIWSRASGFAMAGKTVLFSANDQIHGEELFGIPLINLRDSLAAPIGLGCPGGGGRTPVLAPVGLPVVGNASFALDVSNAAPNAPALLSVGATIARFDFGFDCYTLNATPLVFFGLGTSATGTARIPVPVPPTITRGSSSVWEVMVLDSSGKFLNIASLSNGLLLMGGD